MKSKEELLSLKNEYSSLLENLNELSEDELKYVCGGVTGGNGTKEFDEQILYFTRGIRGIT